MGHSPLAVSALRHVPALTGPPQSLQPPCRHRPAAGGHHARADHIMLLMVSVCVALGRSLVALTAGGGIAHRRGGCRYQLKLNQTQCNRARGVAV